MAAVLSCLIYTDNKSEGVPPKDPQLAEPFQKLQEVATNVATVMSESNIEINVKEYLEKFAPEMMEITLMWC